MEQPRINKKAVRGYRKIMTALSFANERGRVVCMIVTPGFTAKPVGDNPGAGRAIACLMLPAGKDPFTAGKAFKAPLVRIPIHAIHLVVAGILVAPDAERVNTRNGEPATIVDPVSETLLALPFFVRPRTDGADGTMAAAACCQ